MKNVMCGVVVSSFIFFYAVIRLLMEMDAIRYYPILKLVSIPFMVYFIFYCLAKAWKSISIEAKDLISRLLEYSPSRRISAKDALNDRWIKEWTKNDKTSPTPIKSSLKNLQSFKVQSSLQQLVMTFIANRLQNEDEQKRLRIQFADLDANGDGVLQKDELTNGYIKLGKKPLEAKNIVNKIMSEIDTNNNGSIDFSEFLTANLRIQEATADSQLMEAFRLFDKVILHLDIGWEWTNNIR